MSIHKITDFLRKELTQGNSDDVNKFIKKLIVHMAREVKDVNLEFELYTKHSKFGKEQIDGTKVYLDGELKFEMEDHVTYEPFAELLLELGYNVNVDLSENFPYKLN